MKKPRRTSLKPPPGQPASRPRTWVEGTVLFLILLSAAILLFWRLGAIYLWQDEANTAVLAVRMLKTGKPLAYDSVNLLTNDNSNAEDQRTIGARTTSAAAGLDYILKRGDLKADSAWIYQPWGQFVAAGASIAAFGPTTVAARLPFAAAALISVFLLYWLARRATGDPQIALMASAMLVANAYWILHGRQARYYALSSLGLLITFWAYERWCRDARWGAAGFVIAAWCWFQVDYGTVWPVLGVLFAHAFVRRRAALGQVVIPSAALAAALAPFVSYYELLGRLSVQADTWSDRFVANLSHLNQFVIPGVVLLGAVWLLIIRRNRIASEERRMVFLSVCVLIALAVWVPSVAPAAFVRYVVMAVSLGSLVTAWFFIRIVPVGRAWPAWAAAAVLVVTPWLAKPFDVIAPPDSRIPQGSIARPELSILVREVFLHRKDPNRIVVEWLKAHASPTDEILTNYEDAPLMYYLPNAIRGGIAAFRAEDDATAPPGFAVIRRSVPGAHMAVFAREIGRYQWDQISTGAPDVAWGNNPDPIGKIEDPDKAPELFLAKRRR